jgi:translation initiation factor RLI1
VSKTSKSKNPPMSSLLPDLNLSFRNDKEFEDYLIDILTTDLSNSNNDHIKIFSIDDDDMTKISNQLKKFTLITYEKQNFAVFIRGSKYKKSKESGVIGNLNSTGKVEIDEMLNNPNLNLNHVNSPKKNFFVKTNTTDIANELKKINESNLSSINKQEAIDFLFKISAEYETVFFISMSNYQKQIDYVLEIVKLERE